MKVLKTLLFFLSFLVIVKVATLLYTSLTTSQMLDFSTYYQASQKAFSELDPYVKIGTFWFTYPPSSLPFFGIFTLLPIFWSQIVWTVLSLVCLGLSIELLLRLGKKNTWISRSIVLGLTLFAFPERFNLLLGQVNNFVLLLLVLTLYFSQKKQKYLSGFFLGLSILLKVFPLFFFVFFLVKKQGKVLAASLSTILLGVLISVFLFGWQLNLSYFQNVLPQSLGFWGKEVYYNQALSGFAARVPYFSVGLKYLFFFLSGGFLFFAYLKKIIQLKDLTLAFSLTTVTLLLLNGYSFQHHLVLTLIPFVVLGAKIVKNEAKKISKVIYALTFVLFAVNITNFNQYQTSSLFWLLSHDFYGLLLLYYLHFVV